MADGSLARRPRFLLVQMNMTAAITLSGREAYHGRGPEPDESNPHAIASGKLFVAYVGSR